MGYGGYVSAKLPPPKPSEVEAAVQAVKSMEAVEMIHKLVYNCAVQPKEDKFRKVRLANPKVKAVLSDTQGAVEALTALGWSLEEADGEPVLVVPAGKFMTMQQVRVVEAARDKLAKDLKDSHRHNNNSSLLA
ncbi:hypothetical protein VOLCADRAFT_107314 [Volvox carteri f. nagariensis]|uniref:PUB domain-containing protein n=1 Tax=Volvox carteri f. nagariensis TaxID=3068 RepID=D8UD63_VOLCA|nr:uncharacterized protein VOLCADRAFT_107314 [Volvox carteri f. nagariensis]EFJ42376.1 hypothetical protein VOLCADRAFT_107314 [Volvox carteri f. nagariensis]|eukprot:XP_002956609.1 hypothetical protein VOLCADRAFT_107314 [Volvox carteri f. nagariensis]